MESSECTNGWISKTILRLCGEPPTSNTEFDLHWGSIAYVTRNLRTALMEKDGFGGVVGFMVNDGIHDVIHHIFEEVA